MSQPTSRAHHPTTQSEAKLHQSHHPLPHHGKKSSKARNTSIQAGMMSIQAGNLYNPSLQHVNLSQVQNILSQVGNISS